MQRRRVRYWLGVFETEELREELVLYLPYYNTARSHQGFGGQNASPGSAGSVNELLDIYRNDGT